MTHTVDAARYCRGVDPLWFQFMIRKFFVMQLNPGAEEEYRRRHNPIWKELEEVLRTHGVHDYSIALHSETGQLFAYFARHSALQPLAIIP